MTNEQNLRDIVYFLYQRQCRVRNIPEIEIGNGEFKIYFDMAWERIARELNVTRLFTTLTLIPVTVYTEYALPATYGGYISHELTLTGANSVGSKLSLQHFEEMPTSGDLVSGTPNRFAIYTKNDGLSYVYLYPLTGFNGELKVWFKYQPEISDGAGAGATLATINFEVPRDLQRLLINGILAELFPDMQPKWEMDLENAKYSRTIPTKGEISYNLGGLDDDDPDHGYSKNWEGIV